MPIFQLSKAFKVGRDAKVFLNLQGGLTRGPVPDLTHHRDQAESLREEQQRNEKQRKALQQQRLEISQLKSKLGATIDSPESVGETTSSSLKAADRLEGALPEFIVIGAMRCGTSQFYNFLTQHPSVRRAATKEVHYFDRPERFEKGPEWYRKCFPAPPHEDGHRSIAGEATPSYLENPLVPERVFEAVPGVRLIVLLRNPVDRAYSHYHLLARRGFAPSFEEALKAEQMGLFEGEDDLSEEARLFRDSNRPPTKLLAKGMYVDQLTRWSQFFDEEQLLVLKSEDFYSSTMETLKTVQDFLDLPYQKLEPPDHSKTSRSVKYRYEPMKLATKRRLEEFYEPYNQKLYKYLGVDFRW